MTCTRCDSTGFINTHQLPENVAKFIDDSEYEKVLEWIKTSLDHDVTVCDCCGNGESWYGDPGCHYHAEDPKGRDGPYAYNGGLCECH